MAGKEGPVIPRRAAGVVPAGPLHSGGFVEQHWLLRRGERFVQVSELLYRVVELADGRRSTEEIARRLTETTKWEVADEDVARIIERKLAPVGLVEHPDWLDAQRQRARPHRCSSTRGFGSSGRDRSSAWRAWGSISSGRQL